MSLPKSTTCPQCHQEFSAEAAPANCPHCGRALPAAAAPSKIKAIWPLAVLLLPPVLTLLSAVSMNAIGPRGSDNESVTPMIGFYGGALGGVACGILLGLKIGKTPRARLGLSILFAALMPFVCITLCMIGCTFGGYRLEFH